mmetsp:Transcript_4914/g.12481  ORF Transcript_4914/g.12481 Transcript_4914/m.12481 type:complete len:120 (-) Transcript_4914:918-1277(-)
MVAREVRKGGAAVVATDVARLVGRMVAGVNGATVAARKADFGAEAAREAGGEEAAWMEAGQVVVSPEEEAVVELKVVEELVEERKEENVRCQVGRKGGAPKYCLVRCASTGCMLCLRTF